MKRFVRFYRFTIYADYIHYGEPYLSAVLFVKILILESRTDGRRHNAEENAADQMHPERLTVRRLVKYVCRQAHQQKESRETKHKLEGAKYTVLTNFIPMKMPNSFIMPQILREMQFFFPIYTCFDAGEIIHKLSKHNETMYIKYIFRTILLKLCEKHGILYCDV